MIDFSLLFSNEMTLTEDRAILVIARISSFPVQTRGIESASWLNRDVNL